jgi:hypothetical protein
MRLEALLKQDHSFAKKKAKQKRNKYNMGG